MSSAEGGGIGNTSASVSTSKCTKPSVRKTKVPCAFST